MADAPATDPDRSTTRGKAAKAILGIIALALTVGLGWLVSSLQPDTTDPATPAAPQTMSTKTVQAPDDQVSRVHAALHDIGTRCGPTAADPATQQYLAADAEVMVSLDERYPDGSSPWTTKPVGHFPCCSLHATSCGSAPRQRRGAPTSPYRLSSARPAVSRALRRLKPGPTDL